uniref:Uncharacterized protein n=1 Tax=Arundo donax TaxID=35708 RepID=A0A0A9E9C9_ARUDO
MSEIFFVSAATLGSLELISSSHLIGQCMLLALAIRLRASGTSGLTYHLHAEPPNRHPLSVVSDKCAHKYHNLW